MERTKIVSLLALAMLLFSGCGGGGSPGGTTPSAPPAPTGVNAVPANAQATVSWPSVPGATTYNVYTASTSPVTKAAAKTTVTATNATLASLANGSPVYVAVAATNAAGESDLSHETCAVPTAAATAGLELYDALCSSAMNGRNWRGTLFDRGIVNGALVLNAQVSNTRSPVTSGLLGYLNRASINSGSQRVTTLSATVNVPRSGASRAGTSEIFAGLVFSYQPPANRLDLNNAGAVGLLRLELGFVDSGNGPRALRRVFHCNNGPCTSRSDNGITLADPAGFDSSGESAAAYDTTYTVTARLDETTGVFSWTIAGGTFGAGVTGTANPATYLANDASWIAVGVNPLVAGFADASLRTRIDETSATGGSSGSISGIFDDVLVGLDNAPATPWDDFSGTGANSGPTQLGAVKWLPAGRHSMAHNAGALAVHSQVTSAATSINTFDGLVFSDPLTISTLQADFTMASCSNTSSNGTNRISLEANIYNDGSPGTTAPNINQPGSLVGDIRAYLYLDCVAQAAKFQVLRWESTTPLTGTLLSDPVNNVVPMGTSPMIGNVHTLRMKWDRVAHLLTFQVDGQAPVVVDPTTTNARMAIGAPFVKAPNAPLAQIGSFLGVFSASSTASMDFRVNNVFTAP